MTEVSTSAVVEARLKLHQAHAARAESQGALEIARGASERAREFADGVRDDADRLREIDRGVAVDRSLAIKAAILAGEVPAFEPVAGLSENAARLAEAESQLRSAEIARQHLESEAAEALRAMNLASDSVREAAQGYLIAEAEHLAQSIAALELAALNLRSRLGGSMSPIATSGLPLPEVLAKVLNETDEMSDKFVGPLWYVVRDSASAWAGYVARLIENESATLDFSEPAAPEQRAA
jgi:hypothetical protein